MVALNRFGRLLAQPLHFVAIFPRVSHDDSLHPARAGVSDRRHNSPRRLP